MQVLLRSLADSSINAMRTSTSPTQGDHNNTATPRDGQAPTEQPEQSNAVNTAVQTAEQRDHQQQQKGVVRALRLPVRRPQRRVRPVVIINNGVGGPQERPDRGPSRLRVATPAADMEVWQFIQT